ncbi:hypothetical protein RSA3_03350 [Microbacterium testaceum]|uniref:Uncharacterized protein n=1 Tax=Microbacterium testaceum TaxID=2033 RepID=A0A147FAX2_MICTE|nr:hypothetical protein RSA3_03350 [Microbacterium testaceum]
MRRAATNTPNSAKETRDDANPTAATPLFEDSSAKTGTQSKAAEPEVTHTPTATRLVRKTPVDLTRVLHARFRRLFPWAPDEGSAFEETATRDRDGMTLRAGGAEAAVLPPAGMPAGRPSIGAGLLTSTVVPTARPVTSAGTRRVTDRGGGGATTGRSSRSAASENSDKERSRRTVVGRAPRTVFVVC